VPYIYEYPRPAVTVDVAVFARRAGELVVLLIQRKHDPFKGMWALPGGFVDENEALEVAAARELKEETGLTGLTLTQVATFGTPGRDPRGHTVSVAYVTQADADAVEVQAGDDAALAEWHRWDELPVGRKARAGEIELAFDHGTVLLAAKAKLATLAPPGALGPTVPT
jgi:8-oxo-dGTP diphosphatase